MVPNSSEGDSRVVILNYSCQALSNLYIWEEGFLFVCVCFKFHLRLCVMQQLGKW